MKRFKYISILITAVMMVLSSVVALASDVSAANYLTTIRASNSGAASSTTFGVFTLSTNATIVAGMLGANATDAAMRTSGGVDLAFMPSVNSTYPWVTEVPPIGASSQSNLFLYTGNVTGGTLRYFPGTTGMAVNDSVTLEPTAAVGFINLTLRGYFSTNTTTFEHIFYKNAAVNLYHNIAVAGNITLETGASIRSSAIVATGNHTIRAEISDTDIYLIVDGVTVDHKVGVGFLPSDNANNWVIAEGGIVQWVEFAEIDTDLGTAGYWSWEYATTFTDQSGNANTATPSFRTTSSSANITLSIMSQEGLIENGTPAVSGGDGWIMATSIPPVPNNLYTGGGTGYPGGPELQTFATKTRTPYMFLISIISIGSSLAIAIWAYSKTHNIKSGRNGSLFIMWVTYTVCQTVWYVGGNGVIPGWILIPPGIWFIFLAIWFNPFKTAAG